MKASKRFKVIKIVLLIALLISIIMLIYIKIFFADKALYTQISTITRGTIIQSVDAIGTIESTNTVELGTQVSGDITALHVSLGDKVEKGQLLMEIDPTISQNALNTSKNNLTTYQSEFELKKELYRHEKKKLERSESLYQLGSITKEELEQQMIDLKQRDLDMQSAKLKVETAAFEVDSNQAQLTYTMIRSPINGTIVSVNGEEGQTLVSTQQVSRLFKVASIESLRVKIPISEHDMLRVQGGLPVEFSLLGDSKTKYHSTISSIELLPNEQKDKAVFYNAYFEVPSYVSRQVRIGMSVMVSIITDKAEDVVIIPNQYIYNGEGDNKYVQLLTEGQLEKRAVDIGLEGFLYSQVTSGLDTGNQVVK
ncbi:efflux RND transporter periplasmic adaptor subunit [Vibrio parahaemolyticus]